MPKTRKSEADSAGLEVAVQMSVPNNAAGIGALVDLQKVDQRASLQRSEKPRTQGTKDIELVLAPVPSRQSPTSGQLKPPTSEWLTANEAAHYLKVKTRTLLLWARQGKVKGYTLSGLTRHVWRFRQADLDATLDMPSVRPEERMVQ